MVTDPTTAVVNKLRFEGLTDEQIAAVLATHGAELDLEEANAERQYAQQLRETQAAPGTYVSNGRIFVAANPLAQIGNLGRVYQGERGIDAADAERERIGKVREAAWAAMLRGLRSGKSDEAAQADGQYVMDALNTQDPTQMGPSDLNAPSTDFATAPEQALNGSAVGGAPIEGGPVPVPLAKPVRSMLDPSPRFVNQSSRPAPPSAPVSSQEDLTGANIHMPIHGPQIPWRTQQGVQTYGIPSPTSYLSRRLRAQPTPTPYVAGEM